MWLGCKDFNWRNGEFGLDLVPTAKNASVRSGVDHGCAVLIVTATFLTFAFVLARYPILHPSSSCALAQQSSELKLMAAGDEPSGSNQLIGLAVIRQPVDVPMAD